MLRNLAGLFSRTREARTQLHGFSTTEVLMPLVPLTNVVEIVVQGAIPETGGTTKNVFNVWHYTQQPTVGGPASPVAVANAFLATVWGIIATALSVDWVGVACLARYLDSALNVYQAAGVPGSGAAALPRLPADTAVVTPMNSPLRGKNFRGTKHFTPIATAQVTKDELNAAGLVLWNPVLPLMQGQITASGQTYSPCIVSRTLSQLRTDPTTIFGAVVNLVRLNKTVGTMRKRKEKTIR
jgi:hypothetical protein